MGYAASAVDTDDVHPLAGLQPDRRARCGDTGSVAGTVRDLNTGAAAPGGARGLRRPRQRTRRGPLHAHHGRRQLPDRRGARAARVELPDRGRRRRLRPRAHPQRRGHRRRRRHAQRQPPAQLGAGLRRHDRKRLGRAGLHGLRLRPGLVDRRHPARASGAPTCQVPARSRPGPRSWCSPSRGRSRSGR